MKTIFSLILLLSVTFLNAQRSKCDRLINPIFLVNVNTATNFKEGNIGGELGVNIKSEIPICVTIGYTALVDTVIRYTNGYKTTERGGVTYNAYLSTMFKYKANGEDSKFVHCPYAAFGIDYNSFGYRLYVNPTYKNKATIGLSINRTQYAYGKYISIGFSVVGFLN